MVARVPGPAEDYAEGEFKTSGWWVVTRFAGSAVLIVTSQDLERARRIVASADGRYGCALPGQLSRSPAPSGARPPAPTDLGALAPADSAVLCQYKPALDPADRGAAQPARGRVPRSRSGPGLGRRLGVRTGQHRHLRPAPVEDRPDIALQVMSRPAGVDPYRLRRGGGLPGRFRGQRRAASTTAPPCVRSPGTPARRCSNRRSCCTAAAGRSGTTAWADCCGP